MFLGKHLLGGIHVLGDQNEISASLSSPSVWASRKISPSISVWSRSPDHRGFLFYLNEVGWGRRKVLWIVNWPRLHWGKLQRDSLQWRPVLGHLMLLLRLFSFWNIAVFVFVIVDLLFLYRTPLGGICLTSFCIDPVTGWSKVVDSLTWIDGW